MQAVVGRGGAQQGFDGENHVAQLPALACLPVQGQGKAVCTDGVQRVCADEIGHAGGLAEAFALRPRQTRRLRLFLPASFGEIQPHGVSGHGVQGIFGGEGVGVAADKQHQLGFVMHVVRARGQAHDGGGVQGTIGF